MKRTSSDVAMVEGQPAIADAKADSILQQDISFMHGDVMLTGNLTLPAAGAPHPAVVMVNGSGPGDRDYFGYNAPVRNHLARHGIAVLCYDRPGVGGSSGDWTKQTARSRATEA